MRKRKDEEVDESSIAVDYGMYLCGWMWEIETNLAGAVRPWYEISGRRGL